MSQFFLFESVHGSNATATSTGSLSFSNLDSRFCHIAALRKCDGGGVGVEASFCAGPLAQDDGVHVVASPRRKRTLAGRSGSAVVPRCGGRSVSHTLS